jgi:hypothetical protein
VSARDADRLFHETWLGLAQPFEGLVFSVPVLAEAQIAPAARPEITTQVRAQCEELESGGLALKSVHGFFETFLGYSLPGCLVGRAASPSFYAPESGQEVRASFAIARRPLVPADDPFAEFAKTTAPPPADKTADPMLALVWDLVDDSAAGVGIDLDKPETATGPWHYPPTAKLERLLRHTNIPIGFVSNRRELRLVYAPPGETTSYLTFRMDDLADPAGRPIALALELLFHANRTYGSDAKFAFEGLLAESRRRQADVTGQLAEQVFDAVETLLAGFEAAATRDCTNGRVDWMSAALEADQVHEGVLNTVLRLVFVLYAEDRSLLPVDHPLYAEHFSLLALYERLVHDAGARPESMHHRFGAYGALTTLFRAIYFGVRHGTLHLPPRQGKLFDPSAYPFLEGGLPDWTAAVSRAEDRAQVLLPSVDDKAVHDVLNGLIVLGGQRLSYRDLSVEQIGAVYESLMGYRVERIAGPAVRLGKNHVWVMIKELRKAGKQDQKKLLEDRCDATAAMVKNVLAALAEHQEDERAADAIAALGGRKSQHRNRARAQQLVLQPTASRRSTGSHYTPRSLSEPVVRRTLEPVLACLGEAPTADLILQLKICDPAMGSGAFLVEACRFLGEQIVEAWRRGGELPAMVEKHGEPLLHAKRLVAERCLYGVDKNAAAVELAKLSVWLETLSADKPFTFLDHVLRHGDSLVGLDLEQIRSFHWAPEKQLPTIATLVDQVLAEVREHREAIRALADDESDTAPQEKRRRLELADLALERVKLVADACLGAFFEADKAKAREEERQRRRAVVETWLSGDEESSAIVERWSRKIREKHAPFHWHLELPEVFFLERPDPLEDGVTNRAAFVDALIGNPPFLPLSEIRRMGGEGYRDWLTVIHPEVRDKSDLVAHFFRRAARLLGRNGSFGLVATKAVTEGDTREGSLRYLVSKGFSLYSARRPFSWPGDASVSVVTVHLAAGRTREFTGYPDLDGHRVKTIDSSLEDRAERTEPARLSHNAGWMHSGVRPYAQGFELTPQERATICGEDPKSSATIFEYVRGETVNAAPRAPMYIIWFRGMTLKEAAEFRVALRWVKDHVKPYRDTLGGTADGNWLCEHWWRFHRDREELYAVLKSIRECILLARDPKHIAFTIGPTDRVYNDKVFVIPSDIRTPFAILQSRIHVMWATLQGRTTGTAGTPSYSSKRCFETFPFPRADPRTVIPPLESTGEALVTERARYMIDTNQGLTQTYNRLKDAASNEPRILKLRELHETMDRAVLDAYSWTDLTVPPYCPRNAEEQRVLEQFEDAVIDRLFVLNAERAAEEKRLGGATSAKLKKAATKRASKRKEGHALAQSQLGFDDLGDEEK